MKPLINLMGLLPALGKDLAASIVDAVKEQEMIPESLKVKRVELATKADEVNEDERSIKAYLSTRNIDRDDEIVVPAGIDLTQYKINPVILEGHNYSKSQVARADAIRKDDMGLKAKITFAPMEAVGEGRPDYFLLSKFMPLTFSVGFIPLDVLRPDHAEWPGTVKQMASEWPEFGKDRKRLKAIHRKIMLLEASVTPMPSNIFAGQTKMIEAAIADGKITEADVRVIRKHFAMGDTPPEPTAQEKAIADYLGFLDSSEPFPSMKPFPNEHAARLVAPDGFDEFRRQNSKFGAGIHAVFGIKKGPPRSTTLQAIRFDKDKFTVAEAKAWLKAHDHKVILFEPATGKGAVLVPTARPYEPARAKLYQPAALITDDILEKIIADRIGFALDMRRGKV